MTIDGMMERSPVVAPVFRASGSTRGWQDRASEVATAPGAFQHAVHASALAGVAVVPMPSPMDAPARPGDPEPRDQRGASAAQPAPDGTRATLIGTGAAGVVVVPAHVRPVRPDEAWARWTVRTQVALHRADAAIACRWDAVWPDAVSLVAWLRTRSSALADELTAVRGRVELVAHLPASAGRADDPSLRAVDGPGGRWLLERARERAEDPAARAARALEGPLAGLGALAHRSVPDAMGGQAVLRLLVDESVLERVRRAAADCRVAGHLQRLAGPWVPGPIAGRLAG